MPDQKYAVEISIAGIPYKTIEVSASSEADAEDQVSDAIMLSAKPVEVLNG